ncbi:TraC family protein [uncultured Roseobacter sp.]|uniref:TraC family protein n=1 Tax=uncultured Roseobacter sp. TaxID=114847 RepID=UPI002610E54A|nr:TraC family protein [uncultured Roseobacter sp.]
MLQRMFTKLFDDAPWTEGNRQTFIDHVLSDLLTYRIYDPKEQIYVNEGTTGFLLEAPPLVGSDTVETIQAAINNYCPADGTVQFLNWTSPNLTEETTAWMQAKVVKSPLTVRMAEARQAHLAKMAFGSDGLVKCVPHRRRILIAGYVDDGPDTGVLKSLSDFRKNLMTAFGGEKMVRDVGPAMFVEYLSEWLYARGDRLSERMGYDDESPLNYQIPGAGVSVGRDGLEFLNRPQMSVSSATVRMVPKEWSFFLGSLFNGAPDRPGDAPHGPVLTCMTARAQNAQKTSSQIVRARAGVLHAQETKWGKYIENLTEKDGELRALQQEVEQGERLFETVTTVSAYARGDIEQSRAALTEMAKIYRSANVNLEQDTFLQLPVFLSSLPFQASGSLMKDLRKASRVKKRKGAAVAALAPIHGEWTGCRSYRSMLLVGRQGQLFPWDNFENSGNYNVAVVGKPGSGKSVFMQELIQNLYCTGGRVLVIDDGESFKTTCELFEGKWIGMSASDAIRLNPFSMLVADKMDQDEYRTDALELVTRVLATMVSLGEQREGRVSGIEEEYIQNACAEVWDTHGNAGEVTFVRDLLVEQAKAEPRLGDVIMKLSRYCVGGIYGSMFSGPANITIQERLTVFEMSDLKAQGDLKAVVLQIIMFLGTELMFKTSRATRVAIVVDEAWDLLSGGGTAQFLEGVVRRARKYTGALVTGTQTLGDYHRNPAANVCLENSDWNVFMAQKPEAIDALLANGRLSVGAGTAHSLKSLISVPGQFAEMGIRGPDGWAFGRLVLDPYSIAVFSSRGETVQKLRDLRTQHGLDVAAAIDELVARGEAI